MPQKEHGKYLGLNTRLCKLDRNKEIGLGGVRIFRPPWEAFEPRKEDKRTGPATTSSMMMTCCSAFRMLVACEVLLRRPLWQSVQPEGQLATANHAKAVSMWHVTSFNLAQGKYPLNIKESIGHSKNLLLP